MTRVEPAAWLAGFLDGEGYIGVYRTKTVKGRPYYAATCCVRNTHRPTMLYVRDLLEQYCGGRIALGDDPPKIRGKQSFYAHTCSSRGVNALATAMLPYAVTKHEQWLLVQEFTASRLARRYQPFSDRELEIVTTLGPLNKRWSENAEPVSAE